MSDMNPSEALQIAEIVVGSAVGLATIYFGGRIILNGLSSWRGSNHQNHNDISSLPTTTSRAPDTTKPSQVARRDQRPTIGSVSNQGVQHSGTRHRRRK